MIDLMLVALGIVLWLVIGMAGNGYRYYKVGSNAHRDAFVDAVFAVIGPINFIVMFLLYRKWPAR